MSIKPASLREKPCISSRDRVKKEHEVSGNVDLGPNLRHGPKFGHPFSIKEGAHSVKLITSLIFCEKKRALQALMEA